MPSSGLPGLAGDEHKCPRGHGLLCDAFTARKLVVALPEQGTAVESDRAAQGKLDGLWWSASGYKDGTMCDAELSECEKAAWAKLAVF